MKIIHTADLHLGSSFSFLSAEKRAQRRAELAGTFRRVVEYARENGVKVIMLCGDVFDSDRPRKSDRDFFYGIVGGAPDIDFLYLRGNHDGTEGLLCPELENLKTFSSEWTTYDYGEALISGVELPAGDTAPVCSLLNLPRNRFNIVMLHGQVSPLRNPSSGEIGLPLLKDKGIDYLALGHIHSYKSEKLDGRGVCVYCGCVEGRGYDECGDKGFVVVDTSARKFTFHKIASRSVEAKEVDISACASPSEAINAVAESLKGGAGSRDMVRVTLCGKTKLDIPALLPRIEGYFSGAYFDFNIKDCTEKYIDDIDLSRSASLKGEFYRIVSADEALSEEEKSRIIALGLKALNADESV